jgi:hypothetical protein
MLSPKRHGIITGSQTSVFFPDKGTGEVGQRSYAMLLANEMFWRYHEETGSWQTEHGNMNEGAAEHFYMTKTGIIGKRPEFILFEQEQIGGSPDFIASDHGCDWKCPTSIKTWLNYLFKGISKDEWHQCQTYMALTRLKKWKVCAFLTETDWMINNQQYYPVPEAERMITVDVDYQEGYRENLVVNSRNCIRWRDEYYAQLVEYFAHRPATESERIEKEEMDSDGLIFD